MPPKKKAAKKGDKEFRKELLERLNAAGMQFTNHDLHHLRPHSISLNLVIAFKNSSADLEANKNE
jgi:hypothetical protein